LLLANRKIFQLSENKATTKPLLSLIFLLKYKKVVAQPKDIFNQVKIQLQLNLCSLSNFLSSEEFFAKVSQFLLKQKSSFFFSSFF